MTARLLLAAMIGLTTGAALRHAPRDWPEHALAVARRMTFNDSGSAESAGQHLPVIPSQTGMRPAVTSYNGGGELPANTGNHRNPEQFVERQEARINAVTGRASPRQPVRARPVVRILRMLVLPRMRTTPVELRP